MYVLIVYRHNLIFPFSFFFNFFLFLILLNNLEMPKVTMRDNQNQYGNREDCFTSQNLITWSFKTPFKFKKLRPVTFAIGPLISF